MNHTPQHLRRRCNTATYNAVESGEKTFELFVGDDIRIEAGDIVTLEEWDLDDKKYTGRKITRKITYVLNTKETGIPEDELNRYGATICGTLHPDFQTLRSIFNSHFLTGLILEKKEGETHEVLNGPYYLPPFSSPDFYELGLYDRLGLERWPIGIYDIMLLIWPDISRDRFTIIDQWVNGAVYVVEEEGSQEIESIPLVVEALQLGKTRRLDGKEVQLADPDEVKQLHVIEENVEMQPSPNMVVTDSFTQQVDDEMAKMLRDEGIEFEEEEEYEEDFNVSD